MYFKKLDMIWKKAEFRPQLFYKAGSPKVRLGLMCLDGFCIACKYAIKPIDTKLPEPCYYGIPDTDIEDYLLKTKPKEVLKFLRSQQKQYVTFYTKEVEANFPVTDFPEYYI